MPASQKEPVGRNRYGLTIEVSFDRPIEGDAAKAAAELLARDVFAHLREIEWGYGRARIEEVYAPVDQFVHGDFYSDESEAVTSRG